MAPRPDPTATIPNAAAERPATPDADADDATLIRRAEALAERLLDESLGDRSRREGAQGRRVARLLDDPAGLELVLALTDEVLRVGDDRRAARLFRDLVATTRRATFLGRLDRFLLQAGAAAATALPNVVMPLVRRRVRSELAGFVIPAEPAPLARHLRRRRAEGVRVNVNLLGEAVLGDREATRRRDDVVALLRRPDVDYVSVKVSSVCAQLNVAAFDAEVDRVATALEPLYEEAVRHRPAKFVNLDMEEFDDLDLTVAVFQRVLGEPRFAGLDAGIVLQAYIGESLAALTDLAEWARERRSRGGGVTKVRIVKGANLAMERVEAELENWVPAPLPTKAAVDANYKRLLDAALQPANERALRIGVASHNLFEIAWALTVSRARGLAGMVELEMLEGMAPSSARAVAAEAGGVLLYAPVAHRRDSESTIAYLVRRFDENTGPDNFLRHQFSLTPGSDTWTAERERFRASVAARHDPLPARGRRPEPDEASGFANARATDVAVADERAWVAHQFRPLSALGLGEVWPVIAGEPVEGRPLVDGFDPGVPGEVAYRWAACETGDVEDAVAAARYAGARWWAVPAARRRDLLWAVAAELERDRGWLIAVMAGDAGKTFAEADPEVSEAVDFARYYGDAALDLERRAPGARFAPYGTVVVVPPWNFPLAIPAGGVLAALAAGNAVILKPAPETVATARALVEACWRAGIPADVLQFVPCVDGEASRRLVTHPDVDAVVLTGSWDTARMFLGWRPDLPVHAETSGKNALVITATADLDQAVADLVRSAFGHAGQKCSAASLAIVEASVYDDERFQHQLADAVATLRPGPGGDRRTTIGPLIRPPEGPLRDAFLHLGPGESWLVEPHQVGANPNLWSPGVKLGVRPGSPFHLTECFGPVLGVMRAADLDEAIQWQNAPPYGLTAGLAALDPAEITKWRDAVHAGNLYVNRLTTGAVVRRQPFGGWKRSVVGPAAKTGGPNYVASLGRWTVEAEPDADRFAAEAERIWKDRFAPSDVSGLVAEANVLRYVPLRRVVLRVGEPVADHEVRIALAAARTVGAAVALSSPVPRPGLGALTVESDADLAARLAETPPAKLRLLGPVSDAVRLAGHDAGWWVDDVPVVAHPAVELLRWVREQAVSETRHRHGNVTARRPGLLG